MKYKLIAHNTKEQMNWGGNDDTRDHLKRGAVYEGTEEVHSWHTKIFIGDHIFNSVCFMEIEEA